MQTYKLNEIANALNVDPRAVIRLIFSGQLVAYKVGKSYRIYESDFQNYLEQSRVVPTGQSKLHDKGGVS